jgi:hypothetical protein
MSISIDTILNPSYAIEQEKKRLDAQIAHIDVLLANLAAVRGATPEQAPARRPIDGRRDESPELSRDAAFNRKVAAAKGAL